jgi:hypothetical protein
VEVNLAPSGVYVIAFIRPDYWHQLTRYLAYIEDLALWHKYWLAVTPLAVGVRFKRFTGTNRGVNKWF